MVKPKDPTETSVRISTYDSVLYSITVRYGPHDMMNNPDSRSHLKAGNGPVQKFAPPMVFGLPASHMKISIA